MCFRTIGKKCHGYLIAVAMILLTLCTGCQGKNKDSEDMLLYLAFDENGGTVAGDSAGKVQDSEVHYIYNHAIYMDSREPEWRDTGAKEGSLLFDGCSTYIEYNAGKILLFRKQMRWGYNCLQMVILLWRIYM